MRVMHDLIVALGPWHALSKQGIHSAVKISARDSGWKAARGIVTCTRRGLIRVSVHIDADIRDERGHLEVFKGGSSGIRDLEIDISIRADEADHVGAVGVPPVKLEAALRRDVVRVVEARGAFAGGAGLGFAPLLGQLAVLRRQDLLL